VKITTGLSALRERAGRSAVAGVWGEPQVV